MYFTGIVMSMIATVCINIIYSSSNDTCRFSIIPGDSLIVSFGVLL